MNSTGTLSAAAIREALRDPSPFEITVYRCVDSTNTVLREAAQAGAPEGLVAVAAEQTAGRGRQGHTFWSPEGTGLYLSILLRPRTEATAALPLTAAAAVAAARAIEQVSGRQADIQWVNDIYCDGKKVCGILAEGSFVPQTNALSCCVLGVGINIEPPAASFPKELAHRAGAVLRERGDGSIRNRMAAGFLNEFWALYVRLSEAPFREEYRRRCLQLGREVRVLANGGEQRARVLTVTDSFALRVRFEDGTVRDLTSGEVSIRPLPACES